MVIDDASSNGSNRVYRTYPCSMLPPRFHQGLSLVSSWSVHAPLTEESCEREGSTEKFTIVFAIGSAKHRFAPVQVSGLLADEVT